MVANKSTVREVSNDEYFGTAAESPSPAGQSPATLAAPAALTLEERVAALEAEVKELRARLHRLSNGRSGLSV